MPKEFIFEPAPQPGLEISGTDKLFPVHRIYCVGRNYADHAIEMGHDPNREPPFFFQKNSDSLVKQGENFPYPPATDDVHFEMELVIAIGKGGINIAADAALDHVFGYGVGLDMTRRDLQGEAKKLGRPWEVGKAFESSAPCSPIVPASIIGHPAQGAIWLKVNGVERQRGDLDQMIWKVPETIAYLSTLFNLKAGDLIFTGTPAGVGAIHRGDKMTGGVDGVAEIEVSVV
ncbi:fumarylacetoacetate hydrolase family protein [Phyllobacterium sp. K27]